MTRATYDRAESRTTPKKPTLAQASTRRTEATRSSVGPPAGDGQLQSLTDRPPPFNLLQRTKDTTVTEPSDLFDDTARAIDDVLEGLSNIMAEDLPRSATVAIRTMKLTKDKRNPLNVKTQYGQYNGIYAALRIFDEPSEMSALMEKSQMAADDTMVEENRIALENQACLAWALRLEDNAKASQVNIEHGTTAEMASFSGLEAKFDHRGYQSLDYAADCALVGVQPDAPRLEGMPITLTFKPWQVGAIAHVIRTEENPHVSAAILGDMMGLGKTLEILGYWLYKYNKRQKAIKQYDLEKQARQLAFDTALQKNPNTTETIDSPSCNGVELPAVMLKPAPSRPMLLLCLPGLMPEWVHQIKTFSTIFKPVIYHGDTRASTKLGCKVVDGVLTKESTLFNGSKESGMCIVISTVTTFASRHGPSALKAARLEDSLWTPERIKKDMFIQDVAWVHDLRGCFRQVAIDEAHQIKNIETHAHASVYWLAPDHIVLATASILPNSIDDFRGYMSFIDMENRGLWSDESLKKLGVDASCNPFLLDDDHPAAVLRLTSEASEEFITGPDADKVRAGAYLQKI